MAVWLRTHELKGSFSALGVGGSTNVFVAKRGNKYEARQGLTFMGDSCNPGNPATNPFDDEWQDNFSSGNGKTIRDALCALEKDVKSMSHSLFAE